MSEFDKQLHNLAKKVMKHGVYVQQRNGNRITIPNATMTVDLSGMKIPLVTTRETKYGNILAELLWFLGGDLRISVLKDLSRSLGGKGNFWDQWAVPCEGSDDFTIGQMYGGIWNAPIEIPGFSPDNQLSRLVNELRAKPYDTQHVLTTYDYRKKYVQFLSREENVEIGNGVLSPCHGIHVQFTVLPTRGNGDQLHTLVTMRSQDLMVGTPYNIAMYATLAHMVASMLYKTEAVSLTWVGANTHIYENQLEAVEKQLAVPTTLRSPTLRIYKDRAGTGLNDFHPSDFKLEGYTHFPAIKYPVSE